MNVFLFLGNKWGVVREKREGGGGGGVSKCDFPLEVQ